MTYEDMGSHTSEVAHACTIVDALVIALYAFLEEKTPKMGRYIRIDDVGVTGM